MITFESRSLLLDYCNGGCCCANSFLTSPKRRMAEDLKCMDAPRSTVELYADCGPRLGMAAAHSRYGLASLSPAQARALTDAAVSFGAHRFLPTTL